MLDRLWDFCLDALFAFFVPLVCSYHACVSNVFLNVACDEASGLERLANNLLIPCHYLFVGQIAQREENGEWTFSDRFDYHQSFLPKTIVCSISAIPSFIAGVSVKTLSLCTEKSRSHQKILQTALTSTHVESNRALYRAMGIALPEEGEIKWFTSQGIARRPGDENHLKEDKEALREIGRLLNDAGIPWWVDCGTCLGTYRYGGAIPWDTDIDIAVFIQDFENIRHVLNKLDPQKYLVQNWSSREHPKSYLKVFVRKSRNLIDIYHFQIDPEQKQIHYFFSFENSWVFPKWWKTREHKFTAAVSYDAVFPLKKALFDGVEVFVPNDVKRYLQRYYGENLAPAKIYNPTKDRYEKDLSHPYWQQPYVH